MKNKLGEVKELFISKNNKVRVNTNKIVIDKNGVVNDKFYNKNKNRSILLANLNAYNIAIKSNIDIDYGLLGENLLVDFDIFSLEIGTKLSIGSTIVETVQNCTICEHLSIIDTKLPKLLKEDRGIFIKTINSGIINKYDKVYLLTNI